MTLIDRLEGRQEALTVQEVADLLGVSDKHIYEMTADGTLPSFHVGRSIRLDPQEVADWLRRKKSPASNSSNGKPAEKLRAPSQITHHSDRAAYGALRSKVSHLEAVSAIENSQEKQASDKS